MELAVEGVSGEEIPCQYDWANRGEEGEDDMMSSLPIIGALADTGLLLDVMWDSQLCCSNSHQPPVWFHSC